MDSTAPDGITPAAILDFWFARGDGATLQPRREWWEKNPAFDREIERRFGAAVEQALTGAFEDWTATAEGALALIILLDQFTRNIYRGQAKCYAGDERARGITHAAIGRGFDIAVPPVMRQFFYMPLQHSEMVEEQNLSVLLFTALEKELPGHDLLHWAERHRDVVIEFGRFPHRNVILGRESTPPEIEFLRQPGSSF